MPDVDMVKLKARNSSGEQTLSLSGDEEYQEFWFTLYGSYNGDRVQYDFDGMTRSELEDIKAGIDLILQET